MKFVALAALFSLLAPRVRCQNGCNLDTCFMDILGAGETGASFCEDWQAGRALRDLPDFTDECGGRLLMDRKVSSACSCLQYLPTRTTTAVSVSVTVSTQVSVTTTTTTDVLETTLTTTMLSTTVATVVSTTTTTATADACQTDLVNSDFAMSPPGGVPPKTQSTRWIYGWSLRFDARFGWTKACSRDESFAPAPGALVCSSWTDPYDPPPPSYRYITFDVGQYVNLCPLPEGQTYEVEVKYMGDDFVDTVEPVHLSHRYATVGVWRHSDGIMGFFDAETANITGVSTIRSKIEGSEKGGMHGIKIYGSRQSSQPGRAFMAILSAKLRVVSI